MFFLCGVENIARHSHPSDSSVRLDSISQTMDSKSLVQEIDPKQHVLVGAILGDDKSIGDKAMGDLREWNRTDALNDCKRLSSGRALATSECQRLFLRWKHHFLDTLLLQDT